MSQHIITTIVPCEIASAFANIVAAVATYDQEGAAALLAIANAIEDATTKTYGLAREYEVRAGWRLYYTGSSTEAIPCVLLSIDEETRRTAGAAAGTLGRARRIPDEVASHATLCRDWVRFSLHDDCAAPVYKA